ncbi:GNAT family N-acetyltransferase [Nonomuraea sp. NPDC052116]|uniref:GNAT family N-acetyltransferase n=1 Tax=Nonomuraea sp. NPDC052116 TaxID=3155665 RepID=UPI0034213D83
MSISLRLQKGQAASAAVLSEPYAQLYEEVHADPSYEANPLFSRDAYLERATSQSQQTGFTVVSAEDGPSLAGFCYGFTFEGGRWWRGATTQAPDEILKEPKLAIIELMVRDSYRGSGTGKRLITELLRDREEPYATLTARPVAPAHAMYMRWGWRIVGRSQPASDAPAMDILLLHLR